MSSACPHISDLASQVHPPRPSQMVHREECTLCFDGQDDPDGVCVCLYCFNGGCLSGEKGHDHAQMHYGRSGHALGLVIKRTPKEMKKRDDSEPPMKKLAIAPLSDAERYDVTKQLKCFLCSPGPLIEVEREPLLQGVIEGVMKSFGAAAQSEVKAWEEELEACEHTLYLQQESVIEAAKVASQCSSCDLQSNLWLCLTCGVVSCGRKQFGGLGGNGHSLGHSNLTGHAVKVKLGTITAEGGGDVYCSNCDDSRIDLSLSEHLSTFGIEAGKQVKTEKNMTELQIEHNLNYDFSMESADGKKMPPVFGPGLTGLRNLGNSCYMASVLQSAFSLPSFRKRYAEVNESHFEICPVALPAECLECQSQKISSGLLSGRYSHPARAPPPPTTLTETPFGESDESRPVYQEGIKPAMFKNLVGKGHAEFSTMRQQDSEEFLQHFLSCLRKEAQKKGFAPESEATETFRFSLEQRLQCTECNGVSYKTDQVDSISLPVPAKQIGEESAPGEPKKYERVDFTQCLDLVTEAEGIEYGCPSCKRNVMALKQTKFRTFPDVLVVHMKKFQLVNWMPQKVDVPVNIQEKITLDSYQGLGLQDGEVELAAADDKPNEPEYNQAAMDQLSGMGFPEIRCKKALLATGNNDPEAAMNWLFEHMEDADIDDPIPSSHPSGSASAPEPSEDQVAMIGDMGFTAAQAKKALKETGGDIERAVEWLFSHPDDAGEAEQPSVVKSANLGGTAATPAIYELKSFISHKGTSVHSGHYVSTIKQADGSWILFNDEKVALAEGDTHDDMKSLAYIYIYERA